MVVLGGGEGSYQCGTPVGSEGGAFSYEQTSLYVEEESAGVPRNPGHAQGYLAFSYERGTPAGLSVLLIALQ